MAKNDFESIKRASEIRLAESEKRLISSLNLINRIKNHLKGQHKTNVDDGKWLSFEYHDRANDELA